MRGFETLSPRLWNLYNTSETSLFVCVCLGSNAWLGWRNLRSALRSSCCRPTIRRNGPGLPSLWTLRSELINGLHSRPSSMSHTHQHSHPNVIPGKSRPAYLVHFLFRAQGENAAICVTYSSQRAPTCATPGCWQVFKTDKTKTKQCLELHFLYKRHSNFILI